jgi:hypothetical protein
VAGGYVVPAQVAVGPGLRCDRSTELYLGNGSCCGRNDNGLFGAVNQPQRSEESKVLVDDRDGLDVKELRRITAVRFNGEQS